MDLFRLYRVNFFFIFNLFTFTFPANALTVTFVLKKKIRLLVSYSTRGQKIEKGGPEQLSILQTYAIARIVPTISSNIDLVCSPTISTDNNTCMKRMQPSQNIPVQCTCDSCWYLVCCEEKKKNILIFLKSRIEMNFKQWAYMLYNMCKHIHILYAVYEY